MKLEERVSKLNALKQDYEKLASLVRRMKTNEDAPVFDTEWDRELKNGFKQVSARVESLVGDLGL